MPWGAVSDYGHFVLDCLPTVLLARNMAQVDGHRLVFPRAKSWHREHLELLGVENWIEVTDELVTSTSIVYSTIMDHYLHGPGRPIVDVREEQLSRVGPATHQGTRLFLTRRGHGKRHWVGEERLEVALAHMGFEAVDTAEMDVASEIRMFRGAAAIVGATGAAFTNALYAPPGAVVLEIQPRYLRGIWVRNMTQLIGVRYHPFFVAAQAAQRPLVIGGMERPSIGQTFEVEIDQFVAYLRRALPC